MGLGSGKGGYNAYSISVIAEGGEGKFWALENFNWTWQPFTQLYQFWDLFNIDPGGMEN